MLQVSTRGILWFSLQRMLAWIRKFLYKNFFENLFSKWYFFENTHFQCFRKILKVLQLSRKVTLWNSFENTYNMCLRKLISLSRSCPKTIFFANPHFLNVFENVSMDLFLINYLSKSHPDIFSKNFHNMCFTKILFFDWFSKSCYGSLFVNMFLVCCL